MTLLLSLNVITKIENCRSRPTLLCCQRTVYLSTIQNYTNWPVEIAKSTIQWTFRPNPNLLGRIILLYSFHRMFQFVVVCAEDGRHENSSAAQPFSTLSTVNCTVVVV